MKFNCRLLFLFALFVSGCGASHNNDDDSVLSIGQYKLTSNDLEWQRRGDRYKSLSNEALQEKLIQNGRILAYALDHRYDTIKALNKLLNYASRSYATRSDGFIFNKKIEPKLKLTDSDIKNAYRKRSQQLILEVIQLRDKKVLDKFYKSPNDFNVLKEQVAFAKNGQVFTAPSRFPNVPLSIYASNVENAKAGDVFGPLETEDGYLIVGVAAIKPLNQNAFEQEKDEIRKEMVAALTRKHMWQMDKRIAGQANIKINDKAILALTSKFDAQEKSWPGVSPDFVLMSYVLEGKPVTFRLANFAEFVQNEPVFFGSLNNPDDVKKMLHYFVNEQYLFAVAQQMNVQADSDYQQFRRNYQQKIFVEYFKRTNIHPKLSVSAREVEYYYRNHNNNYSVFESATVAVYKFKDFQKAFRAHSLLTHNARSAGKPQEGNLLNKTALPEPITMDVNMKDSTNSPQFIDALLKLPSGQISSPINVNGEFLLISVKSKSGMTILPFVYAKEQVKKQMRSEKERQVMARVQERLKANYAVKENKVDQYLSHVDNTKS